MSVDKEIQQTFFFKVHQSQMQDIGVTAEELQKSKMIKRN